jgi:hypothetical protein
MVAFPPVVLLFDVNALSAATPSEWREFSRVGNCYIPLVVYEEMKMLFDRSPDPDLENLAKAFHRFHATSGWKVAEATGTHPVFKIGTGQALTRRARVSLAVGKCAVGMAEEFSHSLVVLVTNDRSLLQRLYEVTYTNLCGMTGDALLQWSRTGQRPIAVSQKFQQFRAAHGLSSSRSSASPKPVTIAASVRSTAHPSRPNASSRNPVFLSDWIPEARSILLAAIGFVIAAYLLWILFNQMNWQDIFQPSSQQSFLSVDIVLGIRYLI